MKTIQQIYDYIYLYPSDKLSLEIFKDIDKTNFDTKEQEEWELCNKFIEKHRRYAICPNYFARHPLYKITRRSKIAHEQSCIIDFNIQEDRISLTNALDFMGGDMSKQLIDYIITPERNLILGKKHYWMAEGHTFVYGAGRMIISSTGIISYIDNHSGHFQPSPETFIRSLELLSHLKIEQINEWHYENP